MHRLWSVLTVLALASAACSPSSSGETTSSGVPPTSAPAGTTPQTTVAPSTTEPSAPLPIESLGRLAIIDGDGNVVIVSPDGETSIEVTGEGGTVFYQQPTWAPGGERLVFTEVSRDGIWVTTADDQGDVRRFVTEQPAFYFFWDQTGDRVAFLRNSPSDGAIAFEVVDDVDGAAPKVAGMGSPFYFAWGPGADDVSVHVANGLAGVMRLGEGVIEQLDVVNGPYAVPQWTGRGIAHVSEVSGGFELRVLEPGGAPAVIASMPASPQFLFSQDDRRVAIRVGEVEGALSVFQSVAPTMPAGALSVLDIETAEITNVTTEQVLAFFWSPDGQQLLALEIDENDGFRWLVWSASTGESREYAPFLPGRDFVSRLVPFFEQYALSWQLWAPDGSAFAYPALAGEETAIWVQPVAGGPPTKVSTGTWVAWSDGG